MFILSRPTIRHGGDDLFIETRHGPAGARGGRRVSDGEAESEAGAEQVGVGSVRRKDAPFTVCFRDLGSPMFVSSGVYLRAP